MVYGMPVIAGELYLCGGGVYQDGAGTVEFFGDVWKLNLFTSVWSPVKPNDRTWPTSGNTAAPPRSGRSYHNVVPTGDGRIWVITGSIQGGGSSPGIIFSDHNGASWDTFEDIDWGQGNGSHADAVTVIGNTIVRASGNAADLSTYTISRERVPAKPTVEKLARKDTTPGPAGTKLVGPKGTLVDVHGTGFLTPNVLAVYVSGGVFDTVYTSDYTVKGDKLLTVEMPEFTIGADVFINVVGPGGTGYTHEYSFTYT
jgi:hypothetical protein